jgi:hypothetical protein
VTVAPVDRGRKVAALFGSLAPSLFRDIEDSGLLPLSDPAVREHARREWDYFALYACVRGLVAALGFNRESGEALDAFHQAVAVEVDDFDSRRALVASRYQQYGELGQRESRSGDPQVARALGAAATRNMMSSGEGGAGAEPPAALSELVGSLHEALVEGVQEALGG